MLAFDLALEKTQDLYTDFISTFKTFGDLGQQPSRKENVVFGLEKLASGLDVTQQLAFTYFVLMADPSSDQVYPFIYELLEEELKEQEQEMVVELLQLITIPFSWFPLLINFFTLEQESIQNRLFYCSDPFALSMYTMQNPLPCVVNLDNFARPRQPIECQLLIKVLPFIQVDASTLGSVWELLQESIYYPEVSPLLIETFRAVISRLSLSEACSFYTTIGNQLGNQPIPPGPASVIISCIKLLDLDNVREWTWLEPFLDLNSHIYCGYSSIMQGLNLMYFLKCKFPGKFVFELTIPSFIMENREGNQYVDTTPPDIQRFLIDDFIYRISSNN